MGRTETYIVDAVAILLSALLSIYGKDIISIFRRGWTQGHINSLTKDAVLVEAMHASQSFLITHIGFLMFRCLFIIGFIVAVRPEKPYFSGLLLGVLFGEVSRALSQINRLNSYDTYMSGTKLKIERLRSRLPQHDK